MGKKYSLVLEICIWTDTIFKYYVNLSKQNGDKSAILNLILTTLHMIHRRIVGNACAKYRKKIFIGVGDMHLNRQHFQILCYLCKQNGDKSAISNLILKTLHKIHGRKSLMLVQIIREKIFIGVGDMHPDGQISDGRTDRRTEPKSLSPTKNKFLVGDNYYNISFRQPECISCGMASAVFLSYKNRGLKCQVHFTVKQPKK